MLYNYSITPLDIEHIDEICQDIEEMIETRAITCPMFLMKLHPEGIPPVDKVGPLCEKYAQFKERLDKKGIKSGILVQSSLGHGYALDGGMPFTKYKGMTNGQEQSVYCPLDEGFREYFKNVMKTLASYGPCAIMLDDDCRLLNRVGRGCACDKHMAEFNRLTGKNMTREELYEHIKTHKSDDEITLAFVETQREALHGAIVAMREGIDEIDPGIQGINCTSGETCEFVEYNNKAFAGKNNPTIVRVPNGTYAPYSAREFSNMLYKTAVCKKKIEKNIDIVLTEGDTIPFNRYGKNASFMNCQMVSAMIDGLKGTKHWITRLVTHEPKSGKAYRKTLGENAGLYEELSRLSEKIKWAGCRIPFVNTEIYDFHSPLFEMSGSCHFATRVLERLGIPFYFSSDNDGATFVSGTALDKWNDEEIKEMFEKTSVFISSDAAEKLICRGFGEYLGVDVKKWEGENLSGERFSNGREALKQVGMMEICPTQKEVYAESMIYHLENGMNKKELFPGVAVYPRKNGKYTITFSGTPEASFIYTEGFSFLCESRKEQLVKLLEMTGNLPVYYSGDLEMLLRAGYIGENELLVIAFSTGWDMLDDFRVISEKQIREIEEICPDGSYKKLDFYSEDGETVISKEVSPMTPFVFVVRY